MANFFGKAKGGLRTSPAKDSSDVVVQFSSSRSEFEKIFKPFVLKKDSTLAPVNWFSEKKGKGRNLIESGNSDRDTIIIDDGDDLVKGEDVEMLGARETDGSLSGVDVKGSYASLTNILGYLKFSA
jgi:chromatin assembly factor 1 subunit A